LLARDTISRGPRSSRLISCKYTLSRCPL